jgi:hypothetical protein
MAGGSGKSKQQNPIWRRYLNKYFYQMWTNLTEFWHKVSLKNIVWQKEPVENTWKQF